VNYGWSLREGTHAYQGQDRPEGEVDPIYDYSHGDGGCSISGGFVYRGTEIPGLVGAYLFTDVCLGDIMALRQSGGAVTESGSLGISLDDPVSFAQDADGELYVLSQHGQVSRIEPA
jgi:hypothetical protein